MVTAITPFGLKSQDPNITRQRAVNRILRRPQTIVGGGSGQSKSSNIEEEQRKLEEQRRAEENARLQAENQRREAQRQQNINQRRQNLLKGVIATRNAQKNSFVTAVATRKTNEFLQSDFTIAGVPTRTIKQKISEKSPTIGAVSSVLLPETRGEAASFIAAPIILSAAPPIVTTAALTTGAAFGTSTALNQDLTKEERIAGGTIAALSTTGLLLNSPAFTRITKVIPQRKISRTALSNEARINLGEIQVRGFQILQEIKPPRTQLTTTPFRQKFGLAPKNVKVLPRELSLTETVEVVTQGRSFLTGTTSSGRTSAILSQTRGSTRTVSSNDLSGLSKNQRFLVDKVLGKNLNPNKQLQVGEVTNIRSFRVNQQGKSTPIPTGGRVSRADTLVVEGPSTTVGGAKFSEELVLFKPSNSLNPTRAGQISTLKTQVVEIGKPLGTSQTPSFTFSKSPTTSLKGLQTTTTTTPKNVPLVKETRTTTQLEFPRAPTETSVGLTGVVKPLVTTQETKVVQTTRVPEVLKGGVVVDIQPRPRQAPIIRSSSGSVVVNAPKVVQKPVNKIITRPIQETTPKLNQRPLLRLLQKPIGSRSTGLVRPASTKTKTTTSNKLILPRLKRPSKKKKGAGLFDVEVRDKGKFRIIGTAPTIKEAAIIGRGFVSKNIAASFRIPQAKAPVPKGFRRSKKDPSIIIEKKQFRLSKTPEIKQIQAAKRRSKR